MLTPIGMSTAAEKGWDNTVNIFLGIMIIGMLAILISE